MGGEGSSGDPGEPRRHYYWCLRHQRVEWGDNLCPVRHRLGPYDSVAEAEHAMDRVAERNQAWQEQDKWWDEAPHERD